MKTPSHIIAVYALSRALPRWKVNKKALIIGAIAPDIPLIILFVCTQIVSAFQNIPFSGGVDRFSGLYFDNPFCIAAHNILHSPISLLAWAAYIFVFTKYDERPRHIFISFLSGCTIHSVCDILTHHNDGPLLLWPFNWSMRFSSPISHWDPNHFGVWFFGVEIFTSIILVVGFAYRTYRKSKSLPFKY